MNGTLSGKLVNFFFPVSLSGFPVHFISKLHANASFSAPKDVLHHPLTSLQCGAILRSLTNARLFSRGRKLHAHMIVNGTLVDNTYLSTKLAAFYANCGRMEEAQLMFDQIVWKNSFLWNFMIRGYACGGFSFESLVLYREMRSFGLKADNYAYPFVLKACGDLLLVETGRRIHCEIVVAGLHSHVYVANSLLAMYSRFGDMESAGAVFDSMSERDLTSWNTLVSGYVRADNAKEAILIFQLMQQAGILADGMTLLSLITALTDLRAVKLGKEAHAYAIRNSGKLCNAYVMNALIDMYCNCSAILEARTLFETTVADTVSWNSMISGYARIGDAIESLELFCRMVREGASPDEYTITAVFGACDHITALQFGRSVHSCIIKRGFAANAIIGTALVDMYSKCGSLTSSCRAFDGLAQKNLISWSSMISGYGIHGRGKEAITMFYEMMEEGISPDEGLFTSLLSACSHAGLVDEGKEIFEKMEKQYNVKPTLAHYTCLVDLLGRAGKLDEAYELIKTMELDSSDTWAALLSACRWNRNIEMAEISSQKLISVNAGGIGNYICLSNVYAAEKRWHDVERVRAMMRDRGLKKTPGYSFTEVDNVVHRFLVGDRSHIQSTHIYKKLKELNHELKKAGYKPDTGSVFYDVGEEVKEKMLWDHSEKLAIAFALINTAPGTIIRITKNIRVCGDCHTVSKLISKLTSREIIMRDIRRFHHFKEGMCSCGDFW